MAKSVVKKKVVKKSAKKVPAINKKLNQIAKENMIVWKSAFYRTKDSVFPHRCLVKLEIPKGTAIRLHKGPFLLDRKCRAAKAKVLCTYTHLNGCIQGAIKNVAFSCHDRRFYYRNGKTVKPRQRFDYSDNICGSGIHFFLTVQDAMEYR